MAMDSIIKLGAPWPTMRLDVESGQTAFQDCRESENGDILLMNRFEPFGFEVIITGTPKTKCDQCNYKLLSLGHRARRAKIRAPLEHQQ